MGSGGARRTSVSIRAPAWGATNDRPSAHALSLFQFALPRGERRNTPSGSALTVGFNSRSRVGSDA